mgnify:FL=1
MEPKYSKRRIYKNNQKFRKLIIILCVLLLIGIYTLIYYVMFREKPSPPFKVVETPSRGQPSGVPEEGGASLNVTPPPTYLKGSERSGPPFPRPPDQADRADLPEPEPRKVENPPESVAAAKSGSEIISDEIRSSMQYAFQAYMRDAWKSDEYMPIKKRGINTFGGKGLTIIDSLDTLYLMGLDTEFKSAKHFVVNEFHFHGRINVFENNIRVLGGLLSAYSLTNDRIFLEKAILVGEQLLKAFRRRIPCAVIHTDRPTSCEMQKWAHGAVNAEVGTLSVEFAALSKFSGDSRWQDKIDAINEYWELHSDKLLSMNIDPVTEKMSGPTTIGGGIDSTYEYFLKLSKLTGDKRSKELYDKFEEMIVSQMFRRYGKTTFAKGSKQNVIEHLGCFLGGMLIMGQRYVKEGLEFTETCAQMYVTNPSGIACDSVTVSKTGSLTCKSDVYLLRPETVESIFYAWRETHDPKWRVYAAKIWKALEHHCQLESGGFTDVRYVTRKTPEKMDKQESWFLAETMKYLWLIFQPDDVLPLDKFVLNTEAHPIVTFV